MRDQERSIRRVLSPEIHEQSIHMASKRVNMTTPPNQEENASASHCATSRNPPLRLHDGRCIRRITATDNSHPNRGIMGLGSNQASTHRHPACDGASLGPPHGPNTGGLRHTNRHERRATVVAPAPFLAPLVEGPFTRNGGVMALW